MTKKKYGHNNTTEGVQSWNVKESKVKGRKATPGFSRVDLNPSDFDALIETKGVNVKVFRTAYCPNVKSVDGAEHNIDCPVCNGSGFLDLEPICTKAFLQNQDLEKMHNMEGFVDGNQVAMTFPIGIELQYFTLIELTDFTDIFYQRVLRNPSSNTDVLKYRACVVNFIASYDDVLQEIVRYYQDSDFKIDENGNVEWLAGGSKPSDNQPYSIHYEAAVQFRATRAMHVNRFSQVQVPGGAEHLKFQEQWLCTKEFLVKRVDQDGDELDQGPYDNHTIVEEE